MMQAIRSKAGSIVIKILFGLLIVSFGFWGIYTRSDYYQGHSPDTVVATVGERNIRVEDVQRELQPVIERLRTQLGGSVDQQQLKQLGILDSVLNQLIERALLDQEAQRLGLAVSDDVIRNTIYENPAFRGPDGRFDRQLFAQVLMMNRLSEDQLVARLRHDIPRADLVQAITAGVTATRPVADVLYRYRNEKPMSTCSGRRNTAASRSPAYRRAMSSRPATFPKTSCAPNTSSARRSSKPPNSGRSSRSCRLRRTRPRKPRRRSPPAGTGRKWRPRSPARTRRRSISAC